MHPWPRWASDICLNHYYTNDCHLKVHSMLPEKKVQTLGQKTSCKNYIQSTSPASLCITPLAWRTYGEAAQKVASSHLLFILLPLPRMPSPLLILLDQVQMSSPLWNDPGSHLICLLLLYTHLKCFIFLYASVQKAKEVTQIPSCQTFLPWRLKSKNTRLKVWQSGRPFKANV